MPYIQILSSMNLHVPWHGFLFKKTFYVSTARTNIYKNSRLCRIQMNETELSRAKSSSKNEIRLNVEEVTLRRLQTKFLFYEVDKILTLKSSRKVLHFVDKKSDMMAYTKYSFKYTQIYIHFSTFVRM